MFYPVSEIFNRLCKVLVLKGVVEQDAACTANILLEADLRGYKSQGMQRIFQILDGFHQTTLIPTDHSKLIRDFNAITIIDGHKYLGQPLSQKAMSIAIEKSRIYGVGVSGVINAGHIGLLGYYSELAAQQGCIGLVMTTSSPAVAVKGSGNKIFGTNPISYSVPAKFSHAITSDFSTSKVSRGKIYEYLNTDRPLPEGWAVNVYGEPTVSAKEALDGGIQTFDSGIKGASLSLLISILSGPLIGGVMNTEVKGTRYMNESPNKGDFFISFNISQFTDINQFRETIEEIIHCIKQQDSDFRIPGSHGQERKKYALLNGLEISPEIKELFTKLDKELSHAA